MGFNLGRRPYSDYCKRSLPGSKVTPRSLGVQGRESLLCCVGRQHRPAVSGLRDCWPVRTPQCQPASVLYIPLSLCQWLYPTIATCLPRPNRGAATAGITAAGRQPVVGMATSGSACVSRSWSGIPTCVSPASDGVCCVRPPRSTTSSPRPRAGRTTKRTCNLSAKPAIRVRLAANRGSKVTPLQPSNHAG